MALRLRRTRGQAGLAAALIIVLLGLSFGQAWANSPADTARYLLSSAQVVVSQSDSRCLPPDLQRQPVVYGISHRQPQPALLALFAVLRRPATAAELAAGRQVEPSGNARYYVDDARIARASDGHLILLRPMRETVDPVVMPASCIAKVDAVLAPELQGQPATVRKDVARDQRAEFAAQRQTVYQSRHDAVWITDYPVGGGASTTVLYPQIARYGALLIPRAAPGGSSLDGLFPDGVAEVTLTFPKLPRPNGQTATFTRTLTVSNNVIHTILPVRPRLFYLVRETWIGRNGLVLRSFTSGVIGYLTN